MGVEAAVLVDFRVLEPKGEEFLLEKVQEVVFLLGGGSEIAPLVALGIDPHVAEELIQPPFASFFHAYISKGTESQSFPGGF